MATENSDVLSGTAGNDVIDALGGNDLIFASGGSDQIDGGSGTDKIVIAPGLLPPVTGSRTYTIGANSLTDSTGGLNTSFTNVEVIQIQNGNSSDTIDASGFVTSTFSIAVEMSIGNGDNTIIGSNYSDSIFIGTGSNTINGGGGSDSVLKGLDSAVSTVTLTSSGGTLIVTQGDSESTLTSIERLHLFGFGGDTLTIDASASVTNTDIVFQDHNGTDIFIGNSRGNFFNNVGGNVTGNDVFTGNGGSDWFTYNTAAGSMNGDTITDLGMDDFIDLRSNDPTRNFNGDLAYLFIGNAAFSGVAGEYRYEATGGQTLLQVDTDGDGIADQVLTIANGEFALGETIHGPNILQITGPAAPSDEPADANDDAFTNDGYHALTGNLFDDNGSGADSDPDGPPLSIVEVNGNSGAVGVPITLASGARLTVNSDGSFTYEPNVAVPPPGSDSFSYTLLGGDTATVALTIDNPDAIVGNGNGNRLIGGGGDDAIYGLAGNDYITGGFGDDLINAGDGDNDRAGWYQTNAALGGATVDLRLQGQAQDTGSQGWDTLVGVENLSGTPFADNLTGDNNNNWLWGSGIYLFGEPISSSNNDTLDGQGGDDLLIVGQGDHTLVGGDDNDSVQYSENGGPEVGVAIDLNQQGGAQDTGAGNWILTGIENLSGGSADDVLQGDGLANILAGAAGTDIINGGGGNDILAGDGSIAVQFVGGSTGPATFEPLISRSVVSAVDGDDQLSGGGGDDTLYGGGGNDTLRGGSDNDTIYGGTGGDLLVGGFGDDLIDGGEGFDRAGNYHTDETLGGVTIDLNIAGPQDTGSQGWDTIVSIEYLSGTPFADTLIGDGNANVLWGSPATIDPGTNWISTTNDDTLDGGGGDDLLYVGIGNHSLTGGDGVDAVGFTENWGDDPAIRVSLALQGVAQDTGQGLWTLNGIENLSGGDDDDELTGDDNVNILAGSFGNDTLSGGGGNDSLYGDGAIDTAAPSTGAPTLFADVGANGNDTLEGGLGDDLLFGGGGSDTASYVNASGGVTAFLYKNAGGDGEAFGADGNDFFEGIENLTGSAFNDQLAGNNLDNVVLGGDGHDGLRGNGGNDTLDGGAGDDFLNGSAGDDLIIGGDGFDRAGFYEDATSAGVTVDLNLQGMAQDTGQGMDTLIGIENVSGSIYGDHLTGDDNDNWLWGSASTLLDGTIVTSNNDMLSGGGGNDLLIAGIGNHVLDGGDGIDTFRFTENGAPETGITLSLLLAGEQMTGNGNWTLTGIENLSGSIAGDHLTGDDQANVLAGDLGDDLLSGDAGNDTLYGDGQISWDGHGTGGSGPITTYADATGNYVGGVAGNDTLEGGLGDDLLFGGGGTDTASYEHAAGGVTAFLYKNANGDGEAGGADGNDFMEGIENLTGSAFDDGLGGNNLANVLDGGDGNDGLRGNGGDDTLLGGDGNDFLNGSAGNDIVDGGAGFDRAAFYEDATPAGVTVDLNLQGVAQDTGQGFDVLLNIENVSGSAYGDTLIGDDGDNQLWGSASTLANGTIVTTNNDTLIGGGGNDLLQVGIGNHVVDGGSGTDTFRFSENGAPETGITLSLLLAGQAQATANGNWTLTGIENLSGSIADDHLIGDDSDNLLAGDGGNDVLSGGAGNDTLYGDGAILVSAPGSGPIETIVDVATVGGASGDDTLEGGLGDDTLDGGGGSDTASYANAAGGVQVALFNNQTGNGSASGADGDDLLFSIENLTGSAFNDSLTGSAAANVLIGGAGNDFLQARGGDDSVHGGDGNDYLGGGTGNDLLDGGDGYDRASFSNGSTGPVTVDLRIQGVAQNTGLGLDTLIGIENASGTAFADTFIGNDEDNWLWGGNDAPGAGDTIDGQGGNDLIENGVGNHDLSGGTGIDTFLFNPFTVPTNATISLALQGAAQDTGAGIMILNGFENLSGSSYADTLIGDGNANVLAGGEAGDTLIGGAGNDTLYGDGAFGTDGSPSGPITAFSDVGPLGGIDGDDILEGGLGDDTLDGGGGIDTSSYAHASGSVSVDLGSGTASGADGNDILLSIENVTGSEFADDLTGNGSANAIDGLGGNDFIAGGAGDDVITGGDGDDFLQGDFGDNNLTAIGNDTIHGGNGNDGLRGGAGDDMLYGGAGNDLMRGNSGVDYFDGGADDGEGFNGIGDRVGFYEQRATQGAVADLRTGMIANDGYGNVETMVGIESLGGGTAFVDTFYGNDARNFLFGDRGDFVYGFGGDDLFQLTSAAAILDGGTGTDRISLFTSGGWLMPDTNADGLAEVAAAATAGWTVNLATGTLVDGYGNTGTVTGIENVDGSALADTLIGDANANVLNGGDANDILEGGLGNDTLDGGNGTDTASYANASGVVTVSLTASGGSSTGADGSDTLLGIENVTGSAFNDQLFGNSGANVLIGGDGHDSLSGAAGNDILQGGDGNDSLTGGAGDDVIDGGAGFDRVNYNVGATTGVTVNLNLAGAQNTGQGSDTLTNVEHVVGTVFNDTITGNAEDNWLWGGSLGTGVTGNDTISGGNGNDLIEVGAGNHVLNGGGGTSDTLSFWAGGTDVTATGVSFNLATTGAQNSRQGSMTANGFENLSGSRYGDVLTGNTQGNVLAGNTGNDTLNGAAGADTLYGDGGYTTVTAGGLVTGPIRLVGDVTTEFGGVAGNDTLNGGDGDDLLYGGGGNDVIKGDKDNDTLYGGTGNDSLVGGQGNDRYVIEANSGTDTVTGFTHVDKIVFDASSGVTSFGQLTLTQVGGTNTLVTWGNDNSILIEGLKPKDVLAADFEFSAPPSFALFSTQEEQRVMAGSGTSVMTAVVAAAGLSTSTSLAAAAGSSTLGGDHDAVSAGALSSTGLMATTTELAQASSMLADAVVTSAADGAQATATGLSGTFADPLSSSAADLHGSGSPTALLEATTMQLPAPSAAAFTAQAVSLPPAALAEMAAAHADAKSGGAIDGHVHDAALLPAILDGLGIDTAGSIDALLSGLPGGNDAPLAALAAAPGASEGFGWTADFAASMVPIDSSHALLMHCDAPIQT